MKNQADFKLGNLKRTFESNFCILMKCKCNEGLKWWAPKNLSILFGITYKNYRWVDVSWAMHVRDKLFAISMLPMMRNFIG